VHLDGVVIGMDSFFHDAPLGQPVCATISSSTAQVASLG
jgi:hypothetical protein